MNIVQGEDILDPDFKYDAICVTTNGVVKKNGHLVMGAGVAKQFSNYYTGLASVFGSWVQQQGNTVCPIFVIDGPDIFSFPTKNHWKDKSSIELIETSAKKLVELADRYKLKHIAIPAPGCGLGGLDWETQVKPVLEEIFDDRFYILFKE